MLHQFKREYGLSHQVHAQSSSLRLSDNYVQALKGHILPMGNLMPSVHDDDGINETLTSINSLSNGRKFLNQRAPDLLPIPSSHGCFKFAQDAPSLKC